MLHCLAKGQEEHQQCIRGCSEERMSAAKQRGGVGVPLEREEGGGQPPAFLQLP